MNTYYTLQFATDYGSGAYGGCTYNAATGACTVSATGSNGTATVGTTGGSSLVNTGFVVLVVATLACLLIFAAVLVRFWRRSRKLVPQTVEAERNEVIEDATNGRTPPPNSL